MERFVEIPVLLDRHPEIDSVRALDAIATTLVGEPVNFTRTIRVARRSCLIVASERGIELGWISRVSLARLSACIDRYIVAAAHFQQHLNFGCMIRMKLVPRAGMSEKGAALDLAFRKFCVGPAESQRDMHLPEAP